MEVSIGSTVHISFFHWTNLVEEKLVVTSDPEYPPPYLDNEGHWRFWANNPIIPCKCLTQYRIKASDIHKVFPSPAG